MAKQSLPVSMDTQKEDTRKAKKIWATLISSMDYLPGLLVLEFSLRRVGSRYPFVALYTDDFPAEGRLALEQRNIATQRVEHLAPKHDKDYGDDPRFADSWIKLVVFSLVEYERIVLLDSDMLVVDNMDELMDLPLDDPQKQGNRVFAAAYSCLCNPLHKEHYPDDWTPENCPYTLQHDKPEDAQEHGASPPRQTMPNSGLVVLNPSASAAELIRKGLLDPKTKTYIFPDQALLGDVFAGRWVALPYIYNGLKTLPWPGVHDAIWRDDRVKNIHYGLTPKPWEVEGRSDDDLVRRWQNADEERKQDEAKRLGLGR
ncbi:glycosyltransferase family 8 protein [Echria macrotheca]|uniref:Glycosyltransferase family 8 protein n=1 Tax=Echria macrotheca TaxID=438768 RepID=A0AAJ0BGF6_9PEZI|nr:glycosyltransferase family 8 protein [Echria macrotheca]